MNIGKIFSGKRWTFWPFVISLMIAGGMYFFLPESCSEPARRTAFIFTLAACFWATEAVPHYATSILVVLLLIFMLGLPDGILEFGPEGYKAFLIPFSSPVIILFFGGFVIARALHKYKLDVYITDQLLLRFGTHPLMVMMGIMVTTAFLSMWISNTAATAIMLGLVEPLLSQTERDDPFRKGLVLGVPFSANVGGVGTPIGTPPNIIALGNLSKAGHGTLSFGEWMCMGVPLAIVLAMVAFLVLVALFPLKDKSLRFSLPKFSTFPKQGIGVFSIFVIVVLLWLTSRLHGISEAPISLFGVTLLIVGGFINRDDINSLPWDVLILMWGGLALSVGMEKSDLTNWVVKLSMFQVSGMLLVAAFCVIAFAFSTFMSNTATAALLIPIAISIPGENPIYLAITMALACSVAMSFPISTPPNALAFSKGHITARDMLKAGLPVSLISLLIVLLFFRFAVNLGICTCSTCY